MRRTRRRLRRCRHQCRHVHYHRMNGRRLVRTVDLRTNTSVERATHDFILDSQRRLDFFFGLLLFSSFLTRIISRMLSTVGYIAEDV